MIRDNELVFCTGTAPTTTNICLASNIYDCGPLADGTFPTGPFANNNNNPGSGRSMWWEVLVTVSALSAATASQISFELVTASASDLTSFTVINTTVATSSSTLVKGFRYRQTINPSSSWRRYMGVNCRITLGVLSALTYASYLLEGIDSYEAKAPAWKLDY